jgi:Protein of unknown function (DUF541).
MKSILLMLGAGMIAWTASAQNTKNFIDQPYIEVNGLGDTLVTPNEIFVDVIVSENDTKDRKPIQELEETLIRYLKGIGINTDKDLVTKSFNSKFSWVNFSTKATRTKTYQVKVTSGALLNKLFNALEQAKIANAMVSKIGHTDMVNIQMACRAKAVKNAKANASVLAAPLGQTVGQAIYVGNYSAGFEQKLGSPQQTYAGSKKMVVRTQDGLAIAVLSLSRSKLKRSLKPGLY